MLHTPEDTVRQPATLAKVVEFTLQRKPDAFPPSAHRSAARLLLDTLGIAIGAAPMDAGVIARNAAVSLYGSERADWRARMMFDGRKVSVAGAAFAAATQIDNLDGHDGFNPVKGHIGVVVLPTLAAIAETVPDLSGPEALATAVVGYEIAGRAGLALHATVSDYHTSGAWNALGVAAMAARMRKMNESQLREALGIAEYHGPRSQMMREIDNPTMLHDGSGWGAMTGITAAALAENGFTGAPAITVEAAEVAEHWVDLGEYWQVENQYIKPYPICRWAHAAIDATRALCLANSLKADDIQRIDVCSFHEAACLFAGIPDTTSKAQYSLPFAVATMVAHGRIGLEHISGAGLRDPRVASLVDRITVTEAKKHNDRFPAGRWADVQITLNDGTVLESGDVPARGGPEDPFTDDQIVEKFMQFSSPVLGEQRSLQIKDAVLALTEPGSRFSDLAALLYDAP